MIGQQIAAAFAGKSGDHVSSNGKKAKLTFGAHGSLAIAGRWQMATSSSMPMAP